MQVLVLFLQGSYLDVPNSDFRKNYLTGDTGGEGDNPSVSGPQNAYRGS